MCGFCKIDTKEQLKSCVCKKVSYCSKECQTKDWKTHKPSCPPFIIRESPGKGRGLFATRKIKEGQIILDEYPLLTWNVGMSFNEFGTTQFPIMDDDTKAMVLELNPGLLCCEEAPNDEMSKIYRIVTGNSSRICEEKDLYTNTNEAGLYNNISLINHGCVTNAFPSWVMGDFKRQQVRAIMTIEKDQEILISYREEEEFICGSRESRRQFLLVAGGFLCQCSECSLKGEDLEENERMREVIREKQAEIRQLVRRDYLSSRKSVKKAMKSSQQKVKLIQKLNLRAEFVAAMIDFYRASIMARVMGIPCENNPVIFKQEALKYAKMFGDKYIHSYNKHINK